MSDDPELAELVRENRRGAGKRLVAMGALVLAAGIAVLLYGRSLNAAQANSAVQFTLADKLVLAGGIAAAIGALLVIPGVVQLVRSR